MKYQKLLLFTLIGSFLVIPIINIDLTSQIGDEYQGKNHNVDKSVKYVTHEPIRINGDSEFITWIGDSKLPGGGSYLNPFILRNYEISPTDGKSGILIANTSYSFVIEECKVSGTTDTHVGAFHFENVSAMIIRECYASGNYLGYSVKDSDKCIFTGNQAYSNSWAAFNNDNTNNSQYEMNRFDDHTTGINLVNSYSVEVNGNFIDGGSESIFIENCFKLRITNNTITNSDIGIRVQNSWNNRFDKNIIKHMTTTGVWTQWCYSGNEFISNKLHSAGNTGFYISDHSNFTMLRDNYVTKCGEAIWLSFSNNCNISSNTLVENINLGIWVSGSHNSFFINNTVKNNHFAGIQSSGGSNNTFKNNLIESNYNEGIYIEDSKGYYLIGNTIRNHSNYGVDIRDSQYMYIMNNIIKDNMDVGFLLYYSSYCSVHHNIFMNNSNIAAWDNNETNKWSFLNEGNYWDNSQQIDINMDGIGEIPYKISGGTLFDEYHLLPSILAERDYKIYEGQFGLEVSWVHTYRIPFEYEILLNSISYSVSKLIPGMPIVLALDNIPLGINELTLIIYDPIKGTVSDSIIVEVLDNNNPEIQGELFYSYLEDETEKEIIWTAFDLHPDSYSIQVDGNLLDYGSWESGIENNFILNVQVPGVYNVTINILDTSGNTGIFTCFVLIDAVEKTSIIITTIETTDTTHTIILPKIVRKTVEGRKSLVCGQRGEN